MPFPLRLGPVQIPTSIATLKTFPQIYRLTDVLLVNTSGTDQIVKVHLVPIGGTATADNEIVHALTRSNDTLPLQINVPVAQGEFLRYVSAGSGVNIIITYTDEKPMGGL